MFLLAAIPPVVPELSSDDDTSNFDDIPEPDAGEEFFPIPKVIHREFFFFLALQTNCVRNSSFSVK